MKSTLGVTPRNAFLAILLMTLQACAPAQKQTTGPSVAGAYETSGLIPAQPYTRTIFSSHNF